MKKLALALLLLACKDPVSPDPDPTLAAGTYQLVSVDGNTLPVVTNALGYVLVSGVVTVHEDQTFDEQSVTNAGNVGVVGQAHGNIVYRSTGFQFWANKDSTQVMFSGVSLEGSTLTATFYGKTRIYQRTP